MTPSPEHPERACARRGDALAWLQGELRGPRGEELARHVVRCADCAAFVRDAQEMIDALRADGGDGGAHGLLPPAALTQRVLRGCAGDLHDARRQVGRRKRLALLGVGGVLALTLSLHLALRGDGAAAPGPVAETHADPASRVARRLQADGRFDTHDFSGPRANEVGLHGLALLALASAPSMAERDAALRAAHWLLEQQEDDGSIGAPAGAGFDHAIATAALVEAGALTGDADVRRGADRALAHIAASQARDGGWEPRVAGRPGSTPAHTAWTLAALLRARELGRKGLDDVIARGQVRLAADLGPGRAGGAPVAPGSLDLAAARAIALGGSQPRGLAPPGELYAASIAALSEPISAR